ncbi:ATP-binding protein [Candidatus Uhrbacteria bacterium]|nr:ATP-binding protein [Candidatus Uhrbacteria bacterium]
MTHPKLIIVGGSLATGKSSISKMIAQNLSVQRISLDEIKEAMFDLGGYRDREWSKEIGRMSFPIFRDLIGLHLSRGESVVADATFLWLSDLDWLQEFSECYHAELIQIWLTADPAIARERFLDRANTDRHPGHNDAIEHVMDEFDERFFNKTFIPLPIQGKTKIVDTTDFSTVDHDAILGWI